MDMLSFRTSKVWKIIVYSYWAIIVACAVFFYYLILSTLF